MSLYVDLAGEGEAARGACLADAVEHRQEVGVGVGEHHEVEMGAVVFVVVFDVERREMHVVLPEHLAVILYVANYPSTVRLITFDSCPNLRRFSYCSKVTRVRRISSVAPMEQRYIPMPTAMPMIAVIQMPAAVVRPRTAPFMCIIAPPPKNPMPVMTCAAMRQGRRS